MRCTRSTSAQGRTVPIAFSSVTEAVCTEFRLAPLENENQTDRQSPFSSVVSADASKVPAVRSSLSDSASIVPDSGSRSSAASDPRWAMVVVTSDVITITDRRLITVRNVDLLLRPELSGPLQLRLGRKIDVGQVFVRNHDSARFYEVELTARDRDNVCLAGRNALETKIAEA